MIGKEMMSSDMRTAAVEGFGGSCTCTQRVSIKIKPHTKLH